MIAKIAISTAVYSIDKAYSYRFSPSLKLQPGMRVNVPFGRANRVTEGMVLSVEEGHEEGLKTVAAALDEAPVMDLPMLRMAAFLQERYFCTLYDAIKVILPAGLWLQERKRVTVTEPLPEDWRAQVKRNPEAGALLEQLLDLGGSADLHALTRLNDDNEKLQGLLRYLQNKKLIHSVTELQQKQTDKTEKILELAIPAEEALTLAAGKKRSAPMQAAALELLSAVGSISAKELQYFTGANAQTLKRLEALELVAVRRQEILRRSTPAAYRGSTELPLTEEQQAVFNGLCAQAAQDAPGFSLLYGVTGSGKTAIYIHLIRRCLSQGRSAILLVPEIALTPQLMSLFSACFGEQIAVLHSGLRIGERYDAYKRIRRGQARVVLGTRSAVFAPADSLGLLIIDEEQEHTYKSESAPRYHAREVAMYRGVQNHALVLFGSATPSVETMYHAAEGVYTLYRLPTRYNGKTLPEVTLVDMKQELREGNCDAVSSVLLGAIRENWSRKEKTILLLNRRGASRLTVCVDCGNVAECPHCSVHLTYHMANRRMMCHYCGYSAPYREQCPACGGHIKQIGYGTQRVQQALEAQLPGQEILRMDADTVSATNPHEKILSRFEMEDIPVLIGTQMVAKGLNFEDVTLVGVIDADMSLYVDNFRASETTFALLTQVVGRSGRGKKQGRAMIQTLTPQNSVLQLAAAQDYDSFYAQEIELRRARNCPPFRTLIRFGFVGYPERQVMQAANVFREQLRATLQYADISTEHTELLGPAPASVAKINNRYHFRLTLSCENSRPLRRLLAGVLKQFSADRNYKDVTVFADVNPYE